MEAILAKYLPKKAVKPVAGLIKQQNIYLKVVQERQTRHGDYLMLPDGRPRITINANLNPYKFLLTTIHEVAHVLAYEKYGRKIKPHGQEWKHTFQHLMLPLLRPEIFPDDLLPFLAAHFRNPRASSDTDAVLSVQLKKYDPENDKSYIFELPEHSLFSFRNKQFKRGRKRRKLYECLDVKSGRIYLFQPHAEVTLIKT